jgi:hypothetical protein
MPAPLAKSFARLLYVWGLADGKRGTQAIFIGADASPSLAELAAAAQAAADVWPTHALRSDTSNQTSLIKIEAQGFNFQLNPSVPIHPVTAPREGIPSSPAGALVTDSVGPQNAITVTLQTDLPGRSFRGRVYWTGFSDASPSVGRVSQALADEVADFFADTTLAAAGELTGPAGPIVVSRLLGVTNAVTAFRGNNAVHTQRRRALRV